MLLNLGPSSKLAPPQHFSKQRRGQPKLHVSDGMNCCCCCCWLLLHHAENAILKNLSEDPAASALVDEFFLEYHVNFQPMLGYWAGTVDPNKTLADAFLLFLKLRQQGWRAHSWV
jgi:hypothetical protein